MRFRKLRRHFRRADAASAAYISTFANGSRGCGIFRGLRMYPCIVVPSGVDGYVVLLVVLEGDTIQQRGSRFSGFAVSGMLRIAVTKSNDTTIVSRLAVLSTELNRTISTYRGCWSCCISEQQRLSTHFLFLQKSRAHYNIVSLLFIVQPVILDGTSLLYLLLPPLNPYLTHTPTPPLLLCLHTALSPASRATVQSTRNKLLSSIQQQKKDKPVVVPPAVDKLWSVTCAAHFCPIKKSDEDFLRDKQLEILGNFGVAPGTMRKRAVRCLLQQLFSLASQREFSWNFLVHGTPVLFPSFSTHLSLCSC